MTFKKLLGYLIFTIVIILLLPKPPKSSSISSTVPNALNRNLPKACENSTEVTGKTYNVIGSDINVRKGPDISHERIINQKASKLLKETHYIQIDDTTTVYEECTKNGWSWIRVVDPDWLKDSHRGWVASRFLDKGQDLGGDKYVRKISSSATLPYTKSSYPKTFAKYGSRIAEIEQFRRKAAEMAADSGKCDFVYQSELSDFKSTLDHLYFWVDCKNGHRVYLDEFEINQNSTVLTQADKAWDETKASNQCYTLLKSYRLDEGNVDPNSLVKTSVRTAPITHNVVVRMSFNAHDEYGMRKSYQAACYFKPGEEGIVELQSVI